MAESVLLVVSELVTNAFQHADGVTEFGLNRSRGHLEITVGDDSSALPQEEAPDFQRGGGYDWRLVCHLADETNVRLSLEASKTIRVTMAL